MVDTNKVDEILQRHRGEQETTDFERKPVTEAGEVYGNLDNPRLVSMNTRISKEERRSLLIIDELTALGLWFDDSNISQSYKELSISLDGKGREEKKEIAQGMMKARAGGGGLAALFQRQPAEGTGGGEVHNHG